MASLQTDLNAKLKREELENVDNYICDMSDKITGRISSSWVAFGTLKQFLLSDIPHPHVVSHEKTHTMNN